MKKFKVAILGLSFSLVFFISASVVAGVWGPQAQAQASFNKTTALWYPYAEWSFENPSWTGNPFDLETRADFSDGKKVYLFYDGGKTWKLRYMCTQIGTFSFTTSSTDSDLNGMTGSVKCEDNPGAMGLLEARGKKFYVNGWERTIVPAWVMMPGISRTHDFEQKRFSDADIDEWIQNNIDRSGFMGAHSSGPANAWYDWDCDGTRSNCGGENPDPRTFREWEKIMDKLYKHNSFLHLWMFWDCQRSKCDKFHGDDKKRLRLRKYLADRWGAIPNWMIGEGPDNWEDDSTSYANEWFGEINERLAWKHLLGMRSYKDSYNMICTACNYVSWENRKMTYDKFKESYDRSGNKPPFEEDRFRYPTYKGIMSLESQRRHMWWQVMAGGVGAIYGYLEGASGHYSTEEGYPYDWHVTIKTWHDFWYATPNNPVHRFMSDMERCNSLTDGFCLKTPDNKNFVFYGEDTSVIQLNLSGMKEPQAVLVVDTKKPYQEVRIGFLEPVNQTWRAADYNLPRSDWAIAVGDFGGGPISPNSNGDANGDGKIDGLDYIIWLANYSQTTGNGSNDGDFDNSGKVDGLDYVIWLNNYQV